VLSFILLGVFPLIVRRIYLVIRPARSTDERHDDLNDE